MPGPIRFHRTPGLPSARRLYDASASRHDDKRFYSRAAWTKLRASFLSAFPLCARCETPTLASHVHHVKPRKTHPNLAHDWDNLESLCQPCHNAEPER